MEYSYVECEENQSQYDEYDLANEKIVDAIYVKARMNLDYGNEYIEALPYPRSDLQVKTDYMCTIPTYNYDDVKNMSRLDKLLQVGLLREVRFPLPFHRNLEFSFYNALLTSYRARRPIISNNTSVEYITDNQKQNTGRILCGDSGAATNAGFSLIGFSGCGKSSAINILVSHYPQVIMHRDGAGGYFPQIVYLVVNCVANSNFSALYEGIGDAIDKAFGNTFPIYAAEIAKTTGLGKKAEKVKRFIERFGIGIIIFDEIQLIDFVHTRENTFDSLLTLANRTKVAIAVVGTEDAKNKMFGELRTSRRIGTLINGNYYCENKNFFALLVRQLFSYQWFDKPVPVTTEIIDALFETTKGIVDQLVGIYSCMNYEYLDRQKKPKIDAEYIKMIATKYYPGMQDVLAKIGTAENEKELSKIRADAELKVSELIDKAKQEQEIKETIENSEQTARKTVQLKDVVSIILTIYDEFTASQIEDEYKKIINRKENADTNVKEIAKIIIKRLTEKSKRKGNKSKKEKPDITQMRSFLGIEEEKQ